jgi:predicted alpha/beta-hydrolase family hydrolase
MEGAAEDCTLELLLHHLTHPPGTGHHLQGRKRGGIELPVVGLIVGTNRNTFGTRSDSKSKTITRPLDVKGAAIYSENHQSGDPLLCIVVISPNEGITVMGTRDNFVMDS